MGTVETPGGGDRAKSEAQPHAKQIAHASQPPMRSADPQRDTVQVSGNAKWPLPDAWRPVTGGSKG
jgi:hypothetical protein